MQQHNAHGCQEYLNLSRRSFLGLGSAAAITAATAPAWLPRVAFARSAAAGRDVLVSLFLRGGADALTLCVPFGDPDYYLARPQLAIPQPDSGHEFAGLDLDGFFGLPRAMAPLLEPFAAGHLLFVHAAGSPDETRSHFDAQHFMEVGKARDSRVLTGWLARHLITTPPLNADAAFRAIGISAALQRHLAGAPKALPFADLDDANLNGLAPTRERRLAAIELAYSRSAPPLRESAAATLETMTVLDAIDFAGYAPAGGAVYPDCNLGYSLKSAASLIKAQVGVEAIAIDSGSWDTHEAQDPTTGYMARKMTELAESLLAFHRDIIGTGHPVTLIAKSEFGRTVAENGCRGTDHGHGGAMMLMGQRIAGGRVLTQWPGLHPDQLYQGQDLQVTIDYRDVLAEVLQQRLACNDISYVFPEYVPTFRGVTR
jgi:uncharacterized protein (DUF1501 family)